ncbi:hypothetical protein V495_01468 [Pseudogymnoascus sp. VKM F-4514 (FW-929)]|nr:hypothetical protein V495_01468 [Pseudogymnoascus sp. VKM F-4514 (FW-929)]
MPAKFTFGIELEYIVPYIFTGEDDPEPKEKRYIDRTAKPATGPEGFFTEQSDVIDEMIFERVRKTLQHVGLPAKKMGRLEPGELPSQWEAGIDESLVETDEMVKLYKGDRFIPLEVRSPAGELPSQWEAGIDESLVETDEMVKLYKGDRFIPLEVRSPVLPVDKSGFRAARLAIDALVSKHRLFVTDTCGYHVHVGQGKAGFSLPALKNIGAFIWVFEPQLASLHPENRHTNGYAMSMRKRANISRHAKDLREGIREIYAQTTARKLIYLLHKTDDEYEEFESDAIFVRLMAYNFTNLAHKDGKQTIEFRQFCSTTDSLDVKMWAEVCTGIVAACVQKGEAEWSTFLHAAATAEEKKLKEVMKIGDLLRKIGMADQAAWAEDRSKKVKSGVCSIQ